LHFSYARSRLLRKTPKAIDGARRGEDHADGRVHAPLDDGRLVALPAERVGKLLAITAEMADAVPRSARAESRMAAPPRLIARPFRSAAFGAIQIAVE
jgi:hypothetical protein